MFIEIYDGYTINKKYIYSIEKKDDTLIEFIIFLPESETTSRCVGIDNITTVRSFEFDYKTNEIRDAWYNEICK